MSRAKVGGQSAVQTVADRPAILLMQPFLQPIEDRLESAYTVHSLYRAQNREAFFTEVASSVRGVVTGGARGISRAMMDAMPALEVIAINGIGTDAVDLDHARQRGIRVTTTPDVLTDLVRIAQTAGKHFRRDQRDCVEGTAERGPGHLDGVLYEMLDPLVFHNFPRGISRKKTRKSAAKNIEARRSHGDRLASMPLPANAESHVLRLWRGDSCALVVVVVVREAVRKPPDRMFVPELRVKICRC